MDRTPPDSTVADLDRDPERTGAGGLLTLRGGGGARADGQPARYRDLERNQADARILSGPRGAARSRSRSSCAQRATHARSFGKKLRSIRTKPGRPGRPDARGA